MNRAADDFGVPAVYLVVAVQVCHGEVGVAVWSSLCPWFDVVCMDFFVVEEGVPAHPTDIVLVLGNLL